MATKKKYDLKPLLAILAVLGFFALTIVLVRGPEIATSAKDIVLILIGALVALVKDVYSYYFGSSEGSARKTELLTAPAAPAVEEVQP